MNRSRSTDAEIVRRACLAAALAAWQDAGLQGLCVEGRWEAAIDAIRSVDLEAILDPRERTTPASISGEE